MKKMLFNAIIVFFITMPLQALDIWDTGKTKMEARTNAMKKCINNSSVPYKCHVIQAKHGDGEAYSKWKVHVTDWY